MLSNPNIDLVSRFLRLPLEQRQQFYQRLQARGMSFAQLPIAPTRHDLDTLPLSYAQERQWFLWQLDPHSATYHIPGALRLQGQLDLAALQHSFDRLLARHESLRTRLVQDGEQLLQVVMPEARVDIVQMQTDEQQLMAHVEAQVARPFDLLQAPLLRVTLLQLADDEHVLVMVQHHIISDGWSMQVMVDELVQLYAACCEGRSLALPDLPIQYADYALWQRGWMEAGEKARQLAYWQALLGGEQPVLELPSTTRDRRNKAIAATACRCTCNRYWSAVSSALRSKRAPPRSCCSWPRSRACSIATAGNRTSVSACRMPTETVSKPSG